MIWVNEIILNTNLNSSAGNDSSIKTMIPVTSRREVVIKFTHIYILHIHIVSIPFKYVPRFLRIHSVPKYTEVSENEVSPNLMITHYMCYVFKWSFGVYHVLSTSAAFVHFQSAEASCRCETNKKWKMGRKPVDTSGIESELKHVMIFQTSHSSASVFLQNSTQIGTTPNDLA